MTEDQAEKEAMERAYRHGYLQVKNKWYESKRKQYQDVPTYFADKEEDLAGWRSFFNTSKVKLVPTDTLDKRYLSYKEQALEALMTQREGQVSTPIEKLVGKNNKFEQLKFFLPYLKSRIEKKSEDIIALIMYSVCSGNNESFKLLIETFKESLTVSELIKINDMIKILGWELKDDEKDALFQAIDEEAQKNDSYTLDLLLMEPRSKVFSETYQVSIKNNAIAALKNAILESENEEVSKALAMLEDFLKSEPPFKSAFTQLDPLKSVMELAKMVISPESINQQNVNLCGPATLLSSLFIHKPTLAIEMAMSLLKDGKITKPLELIADKTLLKNCDSITNALLSTIRHSYNKTGYNPKGIERKELIQGLTRPKALVDWLNSCGLKVVEDNAKIRLKSGKEVPYVMRGILGGMYAKAHQDRNKEISYEKLLQHLSSSSNKGAILLIGMDLMAKVICKFGLVNSQRFKRFNHRLQKESSKAKSESFMGISVDHYVYLKSLNEIDADTIQLNILTYGKAFNVTLEKKEFLKSYGGSINFTSNPKPQLDAKRRRDNM